MAYEQLLLCAWTILGIYIVGLFSCTALYNRFNYGRTGLTSIAFLVLETRESLFAQPLPARYLGRVKEALSRFRAQPAISLPYFRYLYLPKAHGPNAFYLKPKPALTILSQRGPFHVICLSEGLLNENIDILKAVIAHELAHAEWIAVEWKETRPHWQVDVRAAELTSKEAMLATLELLKKREEEFYRKYRFLFRFYPWAVKKNRVPYDYRDRWQHVNGSAVS